MVAHVAAPGQAPMTNSASLDRPAPLAVCTGRHRLPTLRGDRWWLPTPWRPRATGRRIPGRGARAGQDTPGLCFFDQGYPGCTGSRPADNKCAGPAPLTSSPRPPRTTRKSSGQRSCMDATPSRRPCTTAAANASGGSPWSWAQLQARSGLRVPVELGGGPIGAFDGYMTTLPGWDETKVSAVQADAGW